MDSVMMAGVQMRVTSLVALPGGNVEVELDSDTDDGTVLRFILDGEEAKQVCIGDEYHLAYSKKE